MSGLKSPFEIRLEVRGVLQPGRHADRALAYPGSLQLARVKLAVAVGDGVTSFPFALPPGYAAVNTPATFAQFAQAFAAKAWVFRATDVNGCKGAKATCYTTAMNLLDSLFTVSNFASTDPANFQNGVFFDFSTNPGDTQDGLSDPQNGVIYFALPEQVSNAQLQIDGVTADARVGAKIIPANPTHTLSGFPIPGTLKYSMYLTNGAADPGHPVPIIRDEELVLLRAEAELGLGQNTNAMNDINVTRQGSGNLPPLVGSLSTDSLLTQLLYERRYSLMWEQGTRWVDARRYGRLASIPADVPGGHIPSVMPIPTTECQAQGLGNVCTPPLVAQ